MDGWIDRHILSYHVTSSHTDAGVIRCAGERPSPEHEDDNDDDNNDNDSNNNTDKQ